MSEVRTGEVCLLPHLPPNVVAKWSRWLEWTSQETLEPSALYSIRFIVVPDDFVDAARDALLDEPKLSFITVLDSDGERERDIVTFPFVTFAAQAEGQDDIRALRSAVLSGDVRLAHKPEGSLPRKASDSDLRFVDTVRFMARWQNYDRAFFLKHGHHATAGQITRMFDER